jgi:rhamnulokinase
MKEAYLAIDFGGGSGRVIAGCLSEGELVLDTIYRFPNRQVRMEDMCTGISFLCLRI